MPPKKKFRPSLYQWPQPPHRLPQDIDEIKRQIGEVLKGSFDASHAIQTHRPETASLGKTVFSPKAIGNLLSLIRTTVREGKLKGQQTGTMGEITFPFEHTYDPTHPLVSGGSLVAPPARDTYSMRTIIGFDPMRSVPYFHKTSHAIYPQPESQGDPSIPGPSGAMRKGGRVRMPSNRDLDDRLKKLLRG